METFLVGRRAYSPCCGHSDRPMAAFAVRSEAELLLAQLNTQEEGQHYLEVVPVLETAAEYLPR